MRRLVVISNRKSKLIAASAVLSLTSIHLAATARIATLRREQEVAALNNQQSALSQGASLDAPKPISSASMTRNRGAVTEPSAYAPLIAKPSAPAGSSATPARQRQIVISIADRQLAVVDNGLVLKTYPIAVGTRRTPSPDGDFVIVNHAKDPTYRHGDKEVPPGNDNPLGSRWMGLSLKGYGIHGTNVQSSVGRAVSHGCFRMRKQDVEELYTMVQIGDTVTVRRERDAMIAQVFATPAAPVAAKTLAVAQNSEGEMQIASREKTTVETMQQ